MEITGFKFKEVKKEYDAAELIQLHEEIEELTMSEKDKKKTREFHELEILEAIVKLKDPEQMKKVAQERILEIKRGKAIGWDVIAAQKERIELGYSKEEWMEIQAIKTASMQEKLLKAQIAAAKKPKFNNQRGRGGRGSFRGSDRGRGRGTKKE